MRTKKGGPFSRTAWTKWITSTLMSHAQNGRLVFLLLHQLLLRPERWVVNMSSAWIRLFLLNKHTAVYVKRVWNGVWNADAVSSCDNASFLPCYLRLSNLFVFVLRLGRPAPVVGFHFRQEPNLNRENTKLRNIYKKADRLFIVVLCVWTKFHNNNNCIWDLPMFNGLYRHGTYFMSPYRWNVAELASLWSYPNLHMQLLSFKQSDLVIIHQPWMLNTAKQTIKRCIDKCLPTFSEMTQFNYVCLKTAAKPSFINWWLH